MVQNVSALIKALFFCFRVVFIKILAWIDKILEISITLQEVTHFSYDTLVICCCQRRNLNEVKHSGKATVQSKIPKAKQGVHLLRRMDLQKVIEYATSRLELFSFNSTIYSLLFCQIPFFKNRVNLQACLIFCGPCCIFSHKSQNVCFKWRGKFKCCWKKRVLYNFELNIQC